MRAVRKEFLHPQFRKEEIEIEEGWWTVTKRKILVDKAIPFAETAGAVERFITALGPDRLISICEFKHCRHRIGDDENHSWVIWYWETTTDT